MTEFKEKNSEQLTQTAKLLGYRTRIGHMQPLTLHARTYSYTHITHAHTKHTHVHAHTHGHTHTILKEKV